MSGPASLAVPVSVRPVTPGDAEAYVRCHVACLAETYATIMPPEFAEQHRRAIPDRIAQTQQLWASWEAEPDRSGRAWLAVDDEGAAVGVARSGAGPQQWETDMGAPDPSVRFELHHIYTLRRTHGTGLGQRLLEVAVGDRDAYLWILNGNARAEAFYRRNGFGPDGAAMSCGPRWFHRPMFRMVRPADGR